MKTIKTRSLNEFRQTKDVHYVVPKVENNNNSSSLLTSFFKKLDDKNLENNIEQFIAFLNNEGYKIIKT
jgi:hypothetical protein